MPRQAYRNWWVLVATLLVFTAVMIYAEQAEAKRGRSPRLHRPHRVHRGHRDHRHRRLHYLFGFSYYPFDPYWPYYDPFWPYWPYYPYDYGPGYYVEGEHRRFPAFRMPAFFRYPGAIAKGGEVAGPLRQRPPSQGAAQADDLENDGRLAP
jgi:hypothetical protein